jgi:rod shape-determining protein MreC
MAVLDIRQRTGWLFLAVTVGHLILISTQVNTQRGIPLFEAVTFGAFAEVQRASTSAVGRMQEGWENYFALQQIRRDNESLKQQVAQLQIKLQQERALAEQSRNLERLLELRDHTNLMTTGATVIGGAASPDFRTVSIDKGASDGLKRDMAVISPDGVVGRVIMPSRRAAKVQLLIDRNAAAGAIVERTRAQGVVVGMGTNRLQMEYLPGSADVKVGDRVVTSGIDGIYPKGFVIGQVESLDRSGGDVRAVIKPSVEFSSLESVLVVLTPPSAVPPETEETSGGVQGGTTRSQPPAANGQPADAATPRNPDSTED